MFTISHTFVRFVINGVVATGVHYLTLTFNIEVVGIQYTGLANMLAAIVGITASFLGSRYFVFKLTSEPIMVQARKFVALYASIALLHGLVLFIWTDLSELDYRTGFILATFLQMICSYWGNKLLVFKS
jgi:putative flippase GtrA